MARGCRSSVKHSLVRERSKVQSFRQHHFGSNGWGSPQEPSANDPHSIPQKQARKPEAGSLLPVRSDYESTRFPAPVSTTRGGARPCRGASNAYTGQWGGGFSGDCNKSNIKFGRSWAAHTPRQTSDPEELLKSRSRKLFESEESVVDSSLAPASLLRVPNVEA